jgi:hypothetical protein
MTRPSAMDAIEPAKRRVATRMLGSEVRNVL